MSLDTLVNDRDAWTIALVGAPGVGKTRFISRFVVPMVPTESALTTVQELESAVSKQGFSRQLAVDSQNTIVTLLDVYQPQQGTDDQDAVDSLLRGADAFILMYSTTSPYSLQDVVAYTRAVRRATAVYAQDPVLSLVANQRDRPAQDQEVSRLEGEALARELNCAFAEASAKTGDGVDGIVRDLVRVLRTRKEQNSKKQEGSIIGRAVLGFLTRR
ncbi:P-loop containing nucleoside triphosphate hydrolase protein [Mycena latifolia]|nr:P-loop containing nucleoside triphosphate hydrolase protein [Mycena latifolia]